MTGNGAPGVLLGAVLLGAIHGIEPGHGWPVAASYALERANRWAHGLAASLLIGIGHLLSSIAVVAAFFYAKSYFDLTRIDDPIRLAGGIVVGGPVSLVAGALLVLLGVRECYHGHPHDYRHEDAHSDGNSHEYNQESGHSHTQDREDSNHGGGHALANKAGLWARLRGGLPFVGGLPDIHGRLDEQANRGLWGIAWFAFLLGFANQEEFEIIAPCAGSTHCLELMTAYALTVITGIVGLTMLLIAGYQHYRERIERYTPYLPAFSAGVLVVMGVGFIANVFYPSGVRTRYVPVFGEVPHPGSERLLETLSAALTLSGAATSSSAASTRPWANSASGGVDRLLPRSRPTVFPRTARPARVFVFTTKVSQNSSHTSSTTTR